MRSEAFDKNIREKLEELENRPIRNWNPDGVWKQLENQRSPKRMIPWQKMAIAASLLLFVGTTGYWKYQSSLHSKQLTELLNEKETLLQQLEKMDRKMKLFQSDADTPRVASETPQLMEEKHAVIERKAVVPILIHQLPVVIQTSKEVVAPMELLAMNPPQRSMRIRKTKNYSSNIEIINKTNKAMKEGKKFQLRFGSEPDVTTPRVSSRSFFARR